MTVSMTSLVGAAAVASSLLFVWPQVLRLARTHDADGISIVTTLWAMAGFTLWSAYGVRKGLPAIWIANGQALLGFAAVLALCARWNPPVRRVSLLVIVEGALLALLGTRVPVDAIGICAIVVGATSFVPQAVVAWRTADVSGVSVATYVLLSISATLWAVYGVLRRDPIVVAPNLLIVPTAVLVAVRAAASRVDPTGIQIAVENT